MENSQVLTLVDYILFTQIYSFSFKRIVHPYPWRIYIYFLSGLVRWFTLNDMWIDMICAIMNRSFKCDCVDQLGLLIFCPLPRKQQVLCRDCFLYLLQGMRNTWDRAQQTYGPLYNEWEINYYHKLLRFGGCLLCNGAD